MNKCWSWINAHETSNGFLNREGERGRQKIYKEETMQKKRKKERSLIAYCD